MNFRELDTILKEIQQLVIFDDYKPLRKPFREFSKYLKGNPQTDSLSPEFWTREVPEGVMLQFKPLYEEYMSRKTKCET